MLEYVNIGTGFVRLYYRTTQETCISLRDGVDRALAQALEVNFPTFQAQLHVFPEKLSN
jgi:hypothetical protein